MCNENNISINNNKTTNVMTSLDIQSRALTKLLDLTSGVEEELLDFEDAADADLSDGIT